MGYAAISTWGKEVVHRCFELSQFLRVSFYLKQFGDSGYVESLICDDVVNHEIVAPVVNSSSRNGESVVVETAVKRPCRDSTVHSTNPFRVCLPLITVDVLRRSTTNCSGEPALFMGIPSRFALIERLDY